MKWVTLHGYSRNLNEKKYTINWNKPSLSKFQFNVKKFFQDYWEKENVGEEVLIPNTKLRVDIVNFTRKIAIECNGKFHSEFTPYLHKSLQDFQRQVSRDVLKEHLLEINGFSVIEIYEKNMPLSEEWILETFGDILF